MQIDRKRRVETSQKSSKYMAGQTLVDDGHAITVERCRSGNLIKRTS